MSFVRRWWPVVVLALAPLLPLWPAVLGGQAIGPWDQIRTMWPWNGPAPKAPWDVLQADAVLQFAPWRSLVFQAWSKGEMPFWNPYQLMGTPLLANSQSAGFYPPHILMGLLHVPVYDAMTFLAWLHLFWAGLGIYVLVLRLGGERVGGVVAGVAFSLSAFMVAWTSLPSVITTVAWIPWVLASAIAVFQTSLFWRIDERSHTFQPTSATVAEAVAEAMAQQRASIRWRASLAVCVAMMLLAGHLQFGAFGLMALLVLVLVLTLRTMRIFRHAKVIGREIQADGTRVTIEPSRLFVALTPTFISIVPCFIAVVLGFCLAAPQLLPVLAFSKHSHRQAQASASGYEEYVGGAISPVQLSGIVYPAILGNPEQSSNLVDGLNSYWPALIKRGSDFAESAIGIGPLVFGLLFLLRRKDWFRAETLGVAAIGALGLLIALGTPFDRVLYFAVPGWAATGSPGRAGVLFVLATSVLCGLGASRLIREGLPGHRWRYPLLAAMLGGLTVALPNYLVSSPSPAVAKAIADAMGVVMPPLVAALCISSIVFFAPMPGRLRKGALISGSLILAPLLVNGVFPISFGMPLEGPDLSPDARYAFVNNDWQLAIRVPTVMPANTATLFAFHDVAGYDSLLEMDTKKALDSVNHTDSSPPTNGNMLFIKPSFDARALADLGVTKVIAFHAPGTAPSTEIQQMDLHGPGRISSPLNDAKVVDEGLDRISLTASGPGDLTLRDRNEKGWTAKVDGRSAVIAPGFFMQLQLPAGSHRIELRYRPPGFAFGLEAFLVGLFGLILLLLPNLKPPSWAGGRN